MPFLNSIIQIGPEVLNNTTNITTSSTMDFGLTAAAVSFLIGLIIFFTLGRHFRVFDVTRQSGSSPIKVRYNLEGWLLYITFIQLGSAIAFSLFVETENGAKILFIVAVILFLALVYRILGWPMAPPSTTY